MQADIKNLFDFTIEAGVALLRGVVHVVDTLLETLDLLAKRLEKTVDTGLTGMSEGLAFLFEDLVGQVLKFLGERLLGVRQLGHLLLKVLLAFLQCGFEFGMVGTEIMQTFLQLIERLHLLGKRLLGLCQLLAHFSFGCF
ncbi:hypothetical protein D3C84_391130 [compost metagenome]